MNYHKLLVAALFPGLFLTLAQSRGSDLINPWAEVREPITSPALVIGGYTSGCIKGAVSLKQDEGLFELMRKSRHRYFAHPQMRRFIKSLAYEVQQRKFGKLLVGDLAQARGGPSTTGHASHQNGLDGDFWFWLDSVATERPLKMSEEESLSALSMLNDNQTAVNPRRFKDKHVQLLQFVAAQPEVERVFVHPVIKRTLCKRTGNAPWLSKIRPWWGHHYHFHARLSCPDDQLSCKSQSPPSSSHECGAGLAWWFSKEAAEQTRKNREKYRQQTPEQRLRKKLAKVPKECKTLLDQ